MSQELSLVAEDANPCLDEQETHRIYEELAGLTPKADIGRTPASSKVVGCSNSADASPVVCRDAHDRIQREAIAILPPVHFVVRIRLQQRGQMRMTTLNGLICYVGRVRYQLFAHQNCGSVAPRAIAAKRYCITLSLLQTAALSRTRSGGQCQAIQRR